MPTPCGTCPKVPALVRKTQRKVTRADAVEMTPESAEAYRHFRRCRAVGRFPLDVIVERDAEICREAEDEAARRDVSEFFFRFIRMG